MAESVRCPASGPWRLLAARWTWGFSTSAEACEVDVEVQYLRGSLVLREGGEGSSPPRKLRAVKWNCRPDITLARVKEEIKFVRV